MFVPFHIPQTGYPPVVHMLFCFVLSVFYYPILKVKTLSLVSMSSEVNCKLVKQGKRKTFYLTSQT